MTKLLLSEVQALDAEAFTLLNEKIAEKEYKGRILPFPLRFRIETKLIPFLERSMKPINKEIFRIAGENGAIIEGETWSYKDKDGKIIDQEKLTEFTKKVNEFLKDEVNAIECPFTLSLSLFSSIEGEDHYKVLCKLIVED